MRIISKFKDCYDRFSTPTEPVFIRKESEEQISINGYFPEGKVPIDNPVKYWETSRIFSGFVLGFCGKIYFGMQTCTESEYQYECFYSEESLYKKYPKITRSKQFKQQDNFNYNHDMWGISLGFNLPFDVQKRFHQYFNSQCPIFIITDKGAYEKDYKLTRNPNCKQWEVYKLFPIPQMFQEIEMYLGGFANPDKKIPDISDKDLLEAKGFDKFSFRKDKSK